VPDTTVRHAAVRSVASTLPERVVPNAPIAQRAGVSEDWIVARTGIRERRAVTPDERLTDLATAAGAAALGGAALLRGAARGRIAVRRPGRRARGR
jgi:3-oxoacyl-[acyl-carrier-protein] synthase-3